MSRITCLASNVPLPERENPHYRSVSINEALELGMEVPEFMLNAGFDRNMPGMLLWSDLNISITDNGQRLDDGGFDDDYSISLPDNYIDCCTQKNYCLLLDWRYSPGRADSVIDYIRTQLDAAGEIEIWRLSTNIGDAPIAKRRTVSILELTSEDFRWLETQNVSSYPYTQYCITVTK